MHCKKTLLAYLVLMLSSIASALGFWNSSGVIWTRSEIVVCREHISFSRLQEEVLQRQLEITYENKHCLLLSEGTSRRVCRQKVGPFPVSQPYRPKHMELRYFLEGSSKESISSLFLSTYPYSRPSNSYSHGASDIPHTPETVPLTS